MPMKPEHALLHRLIDYAGLFPPASLPLEQAAAEFAKYLDGPDAPCLGRFVIPVDRLEELGQQVGSLDTTTPWPVSVLVGSELALGVEKIVDTLDRFEKQWVLVESLEAVAETPDAFEPPTLAGVEVFFEIAPDDNAKSMIALAGETGVSVKIRTGGVEANQFPSTADVVRFIRSCAASRVAFKATAGLHHPFPGFYPLTYDAESAQGYMHGFMNLFLTAMLIWNGTVDFKMACALLADMTPPHWDEEAAEIQWGDWSFTEADVRLTRSQFSRSFGSCSFSEPLEALRENALL